MASNRLEYLSIVIPLIILFSGLLFYSQKIPSESATHTLAGFVVAFIIIAVILIAVSLYGQLMFLYHQLSKKHRKVE